jgi:hypothetical protein
MKRAGEEYGPRRAGAAGELRLNPAALFFDYYCANLSWASVAMMGFNSRKCTSAGFYGAMALAFCFAGAARSPAAAQSIGSAYTDYDTKTCSHKAGREVEDYGEWRCKGLNGMAVLVDAGDQRMTMSFGPRAKNEPAAGQTLQRFNDVYKARIEWRFARAAGGRIQPFAAIVRWSTVLPDESAGEADTPGPKTASGKVLVVTRLGPRGVCHVGYVDALANRNADALARKIADEHARPFRCDTDKPIIVGETGPGFSSSSEAEKVDR